MNVGLVVSILALLFGSGTIGGYFIGRIRATEKKTEAVCKGVQALLRDRLIQSYNYQKEKGYASIDTKENFENMWKQYHNLGQNGVMCDLRERFMSLPTEKED